MRLVAAGWHLGFGTFPLLTTLILVIVTWVIISIPVYLAAKIMTGGKATFIEALLGSVAGPIVYFVTLGLAEGFLSLVFFPISIPVGFLLALLALLWVYKAVFGTSWLGAFLIALVATVFTIVLAELLAIVAIVL
jgi:hypothetical protein